MNYSEQAVVFGCQGESLIGIASLPAEPATRAVLIVVGGPQYRAGSHRQFTLLARSLAADGIASLRFDYRGMGDSGGEARSFESVNEDLRAAVDCLFSSVPGVRDVVIWGLCDAASAALFYASADARVRGLVLLNPWVRTSGGEAKAILKHYYRDRLLQPALWKKIASGKFELGGALRSLGSVLAKAVGGGAATGSDGAATAAAGTLPERMLDGLSAFQGQVLLILSGRDLTAQEFTDLVGASPAWQRALGGSTVRRQDFAEADHTFSRRAWRDQVATWTSQWITSW
ncbi:hydrolase 1, exosortase A system-associated [Massilia sp. PWRC2]|uniref:hydrolase 1, exosortase A system-associated n=1 Tax=Massilia sp. PWRC2 TaxID=2804626 RepID=UPI003CEBDE2B